jgi:tripartite-type tricarboxylate transporter receptor subunit TctC
MNRFPFPQDFFKNAVHGVLVGIAFMVCPAYALETYPSKSVRVIAAFPPGGFVDLGARVVSVALGAGLGQSFVVDNKPGAGGIVGTEVAAHAAPDGYTLIVGSVGTHAVNQSLYKKLPYHVTNDFSPVTRLADAPSILAVHPSLPVKNVLGLIRLARERPKQILYASAGSGTSTHLAAVLFENLAGIQLVHVPYKGGGPAIVDVLSGQVPVTFGTAASVSAHTKNNQLRALAVTAGQRSMVLPDLPTMAESGLPGYEMLNWLGLFAPAHTSQAIIERLNQEAMRVLRLSEVRERLNAAGAEPSALETKAFVLFAQQEVLKWSKVVSNTRMSAD